jgi:hypothetical protein
MPVTRHPPPAIPFPSMTTKAFEMAGPLGIISPVTHQRAAQLVTAAILRRSKIGTTRKVTMLVAQVK